MKKGETADFNKAQDIMRYIFSQIQSNSKQNIVSDKPMDKQMQDKNSLSIEEQLITMAVQLDQYIKKHI